jgi:hypothetical protein
MWELNALTPHLNTSETKAFATDGTPFAYMEVTTSISHFNESKQV